MSENYTDIRNHLPEDLKKWRSPGEGGVSDEVIWEPLRKFFQGRGYTFWIDSPPPLCRQCAPDDNLENNGHAFATLQHGFDRGTPFNKLYQFSPPSPVMRAARTTNGHDVIIRVLAVDSQGQEVVDILKFLAMSAMSVADRNHTLPILELIELEGITFGIFLKVACEVRDVYGSWPKNSVGDVIDMVLQCLEALSFIHWLGVAHRDAFKDNFLVQYHPESMDVGTIPATRPRVYLHDFETAIMFPEETPSEQWVCVGKPLADSFSADGQKYSRPLPHDVLSGEPYSPFKLDVWQFGTSLQDFKSSIPEIDNILKEMRNPDASTRISANDAKLKLLEVVATLPPKSLLISPQLSEMSAEDWSPHDLGAIVLP